MKKLLLGMTMIGLLVLVTPAWGAGTESVSPVVIGIDPGTAANDLDTTVTITGTGFATDQIGTVPPTASLGATALTDVTLVDATTITATVPWGTDPGMYDLTLTNPGGGSATLTGAFVLKPGIGRWNGSELYGGDVRQVVLKPGDPNTLYALASGLQGLFRSTDAGENWTYTGGDLSGDTVAVTPQHPDWLWAYAPEGVKRSTDGGDTWTTVMSPAWPNGLPIARGQVYPSPSDPDVVFVSSYDDPAASGTDDEAQGLIRSADGGATWTIVKSLDGVRVVDVAFRPDDGSQMTLVTQDAHVYHSNDAGRTWELKVAKPALGSIGFEEELAYNPSVPGEVWILSNAPDGVFKSADTALGGWEDVTPPYSRSPGIAFTGPGAVHLTHWTSANGGADWDWSGPVSANGAIVFDPGDPQVGFVGDGTYAVQKTTDGGATWQVKDHGLAGMTCRSMAVSRADPLLVFAAFGNWPGVYRSADGAGTWTYREIPGAGTGAMSLVRPDPDDANGVYAVSGHLYRSADSGESWTDLGWSASAPPGALFDVEPDPFQAGHLLAALDTGDYLTGPGYLYESIDAGISWQAVATPQALARITDITFDPETAGLVYLATGGAGNIILGTGVYRSTDGGAHWERVDDLQRPDMASAQTVTIATHPQHVVFVDGREGDYRSTDRGATWQKTAPSPGSSYLFADADSTRLYCGAWNGLYFSSDVGKTWARATGAFGRLQITALGCARAGAQTIVYAATNGGQAGAHAASPAREGAVLRRTAAAAGVAPTASQMVGAGIYRYVVVRPRMTLKLSGLSGGALRLGRRVTSTMRVTPSALGGASVRLKMQRWARKWVTLKTVTRTVDGGGACRWAYEPARRGLYRVQSTNGQDGDAYGRDHHVAVVQGQEVGARRSTG
jgi:photosystem II stability/assembly factor-like uncharacterized protein